MSRRIVAVALVALLIASVLLGLGAASNARAAPSSSVAPAVTIAASSPHPAVSTIIIESYNGGGVSTTSFCTGGCATINGHTPGGNSVYFSVEDTSADHSLNLSLNDPNATRDGLTNPVFHANLLINQTSHFNQTYYNNHLVYTFPSALVDGGGWNITASAPLGGVQVLNITVHTYRLGVQLSPANGSIVIPGETVTLTWEVIHSVNGALDPAFTKLTVWGTYTNGTNQNLFTPGLYSLPLADAGTYSFQIPVNAIEPSQITFRVAAVNNLSGTIAENETSGLFTLSVGAPYIENVVTNSEPGCPTGVGNQLDFASGSPVFVCALLGAEAYDAFSYVPGLSVEIRYWNGLVNVTPSGNAPTVLTTSSSGVVSFGFLATSPLFSSYYSYPFGNSVNLTVTDPAATNVTYPHAQYNASFQVLPDGPTGAVMVELNAVDYAQGQTVFANWTLGSSNSTAIGALTANRWTLVSVATGNTLEGGPISAITSSGLAEVVLPAGFLGQFDVRIYANNATQTFSGQATGLAVQPAVVLTASSGVWFDAGQTISFAVEVVPTALASTVLYYNISGEWRSALGGISEQGIVAVGTVGPTGVINYVTPNVAPATYYFVTVWAQSPLAGTYAFSEVEVDLVTGFSVAVGIATASSYADGSYQPGQTVQVSYKITDLSGAPLPNHFVIDLYFYDTQVEPEIETSSSSGTVSMTIPSGTPSGQVFVELYVYGQNLYGPNCGGGDYCYGESGMQVNANPSVLSEELGAGSGLTVGWLILLVVIIVVGLLLFVVIRRDRSPKTPVWNEGSDGGKGGTEAMSAPAPAPSSPPAAEWKAPETPPSTTDSPPPLPTPPTESS